jgi:hypothetical protein
MEPAQTPDQIVLGKTSQYFLKEAAAWGRFLAVCGFIMIAFMILLGIFFSWFMSKIMSSLPAGSTMGGAVGAFYLVICLVLALIYFFPTLNLYRFSVKIPKGIDAKDDTVITEAFMNQKSLYKFMGILTIIILCFYAMVIVFFIVMISSGLVPPFNETAFPQQI